MSLISGLLHGILVLGILIGNWWQREALISPTDMTNLARLIIGLLVSVGLGSCGAPSEPLSTSIAEITNRVGEPPEEGMSVFPIPFDDIPGWRGERHSAVLPAFLRSCSQLRDQPPDKAMGQLAVMGKISQWVAICEDAEIIRPGNDTEAQYFFESRFVAYRVSHKKGNRGLITGYYEPVLRGSWAANAQFRHPLYSLPKDLVSAKLGGFDDKWQGKKIFGRITGKQLVPYYSRSEIENGALQGRRLEILWVDSAVDAFFLHIQGSGKVILPDDTHVRIGYAGSNGQRYTSIGRELVALGAMPLEAVTMPSIRAWMEAQPVAANALMHKNKSYIFFRVLDGKGPIGAQGVALTPGRSLAVDRKFWPLGVPVWMDTTEPGVKPEKALRRLGVAQDTGSAIQGAVRADYFWGHGQAAGQKAGIMKQQGMLYMLLPRIAAREDGPEPCNKCATF